MKNFLVFSLLLVWANVVFAQSSDVYSGPVGVPAVSPVSANQQPKLESSGFVVFDNGPLVNYPGQGVGGADVSAKHGDLLVYGGGFQYSFDNRLADDFIFTENTDISSFVFFAYQTNSSTTSTITGAYIQIYDQRPDQPGATVIWGDRINNRLSSSTFSGIYRCEESNLTNSERPIMRIKCNARLTLPAGTYWVEVSIDGSLSSGPWCPMVTISGQPDTGNAWQSASSGWVEYLDQGHPQGIPFIIMGTPHSVPFKIWYLAFVFLAIATGLVVKRRFF